MKPLAFWKLDAFTDGTSAGNPAGMVLLDEATQLSESEMQQVAAELGGFVSEVAFVRTAGAAVELRYFSRECEVAFCGHATLAVCHHLLSSLPSQRGLAELRLSTPKGPLTVENRLDEDGCVYVEAPMFSLLSTQATPTQAARALGLDVSAVAELPPEQPLPFVECGLRCLLVPVTRPTQVLDCRPDYDTLRAFLLEIGAETAVLFAPMDPASGSSLWSRVFPPPFGYLEDPATGSGNAALAGWLRSRGQWTQSTLAIAQGPHQSHPNHVKIRMGSNNQLQIGGKAVVRIEGCYLLHGRPRA
jgi:PhzF family phenazine biosynthesis protein